VSPERILTPLGREIASDPSIHEKLWSGAMYHAKNEVDADDLFQETIALALADEASGAWRPGGELSAYQLCSKKLRNIAGNWRKGIRRRVARHADDEEGEKAPTSSPNPDEALRLRDEHLGKRKLVDEVRAELRRLGAGGRIPLLMLEWADKEVESHQELADRIGCELTDIRKASRRLAEAAQRVLGRQAEGGAS